MKGAIVRQLCTRGDGESFFPTAILIKLRKWCYSPCSKYLVDTHSFICSTEKTYTEKCEPKKQSGLQTEKLFKYYDFLSQNFAHWRNVGK